MLSELEVPVSATSLRVGAVGAVLSSVKLRSLLALLPAASV
jgi:hypothetical protein